MNKESNDKQDCKYPRTSLAVNEPGDEGDKKKSQHSQGGMANHEDTKSDAKPV